MIFFKKKKIGNITWMVLACFRDAMQLWYKELSRQEPEHLWTRIWSGIMVEPLRTSAGSCKYSIVCLGSQAGLALLAAWTSLAWHCLKTSKNARNLTTQVVFPTLIKNTVQTKKVRKHFIISTWQPLKWLCHFLSFATICSASLIQWNKNEIFVWTVKIFFTAGFCVMNH